MARKAEGQAALQNALEIEAEPLTNPVAEALIAALNGELSALYPEPGANHFRLGPDEVAPGNGIFVVARWHGRPVGCGALRCIRDAVLMRELGPRVEIPVDSSGKLPIRHGPGDVAPGDRALHAGHAGWHADDREPAVPRDDVLRRRFE